MNLKNTLLQLLFISIIAYSTYGYSQKTGAMFLPEKSLEMPSWMNLFYNEVTDIEVIEKAYNEYYNTHRLKKNAYTQYYKRWMIEHSNDVLVQGNEITENEIKGRADSPQKTSAKGNNKWSLIGPEDTFYPSWNNNKQPSVPWQVNIYCFDIAASNPSILYACPETGGIFKSIDKGLTWISVSDSIKLGTVSAIAIHPTSPDTVYASSGSNVYKTIDGGKTWKTIFTSTGLACNDIAILSSAPSTLIVGGAKELFKSINSGASFTAVPNFSGAIFDIEINPGRDSSIYVLRKASGDTLIRFYLSYDEGNTFKLISNGWISGISNGARMTVTPADTSYIFTAILMGGSIGAPAILRSTDGGQHWKKMCTGIQNSLQGNNSSPLGMSNGQGYYDLSIMASTTNPAQVIVGTTSAYKSLDTANTFKSIGGYVGSFPIHPDIQEMKMIGNDAWISTDGGLNYSTDFFTSATNLSSRNNGIYGSHFWGYGQGWNVDLAVGGRYHNGNTAMYDAYPKGSSLRLGGGEAGTGYVMLGRDMYAAFSDIAEHVLPKTFSGNKKSWKFTITPNEDAYGKDASEVEFYPSCYNHIYVGKDSSLWKSENGGISFLQVYNFHERVKKFEICRSNSLVMYLATNKNLHKTSDGGISWQKLTLPNGASLSQMSISVSFTDENTLWITSKSSTSNNKIFKSVDGAKSWKNLTTATVNGFAFQTINHQAGTKGGVYISSASNAKVFYLNDSMPDWVNISSNLPFETQPVSTKPFYMKSKFRLAGNRGIWETDFYEDGAPVAQATTDKLTATCENDTFYFDDFSAVNHSLVSWHWTFTGAKYVSDSTIRNPKVLFTGLGKHQALLSVTQQGIVDTSVITISITDNSCVLNTSLSQLKSNPKVDNYSLKTFPNPVKNEMYVVFYCPTETFGKIAVYDMQGNSVLSTNQKIKSGKNDLIINTSELSSGTYNLSIVTDDNVYSNKIVIEK